MQSTMQNVALTIPSIVRHAVAVHGDSEVMTFDGTGFRRTSYRTLSSRIGRLANALRDLGITADQRVATFQWSNQDHMEAYCAVPSMGAVLHTLNIRLTPEQLAFIANDAEDQIVIVDTLVASILAQALPAMASVHTVIAVGDGALDPLLHAGKTVLRYDELLASHDESFDWPELDELSAAAMCYTSGTTGNPKGVVYSHRSTYLHSLTACTSNALSIGEADRVLAIVPMFHANAWGLIYAALMSGADLVLPDRHLQAAPLVSIIEDSRPTIAGAVPTIWNDVARLLDADPTRDISSLRLVACGGSAVPLSLMKTFDNRYGVPIVQAWGMTETSPLATVAQPAFGADEDRAWEMRATQGRPVCGVEIRLRDDDSEIVPWDGQSVGEIEVRGPWITGSYFKDVDADKFDDGWLRTGDVGRIDPDGYLTLTDRSKDVIKSGGEWISSVELENALIGHAAVYEAAVIGVPDEKWQERPLALIVLHEGARTDIDELCEFLSGKVAKWWVPERWSFVAEIPRTSVGKYDKKVIRAKHAQGAYDVVQSV
ncbi:long-chain fatty acid--CoA ligase [Mycobacterium vulneris]|uniref:Long-chain-fatty-acid--CoA ligase FadD13 n=2 Tax=Mycobacteriaceae TaxID=1762 RepID=A0A7X6MWG2_9MYCO|nr:fatty acid--CoA ligase [Mycolicibacterium septicum DSM 44393]OBK07486.1 long-chain fatty acid--CoA ligase [Mycolicibacterium fortuitum]OCB44914.1 long-chain fatty acid--CoA ligase [Mycolicibacterium vulneris]OBK57263.1 long-chain fatty acid--CoA ligase [Mycolicibacterium fortuitum]OCB60547.1 long-chain fatty acid--CoA ligase [Mycolicibacterium vulneris]